MRFWYESLIPFPFHWKLREFYIRILEFLTFLFSDLVWFLFLLSLPNTTDFLLSLCCFAQGHSVLTQLHSFVQDQYFQTLLCFSSYPEYLDCEILSKYFVEWHFCPSPKDSISYYKASPLLLSVWFYDFSMPFYIWMTCVLWLIVILLLP